MFLPPSNFSTDFNICQNLLECSPNAAVYHASCYVRLENDVAISKLLNTSPTTTMEPQHLIQSSTLPPAQPTYVFRGHTAQIHAVHFLQENLRFLSGDADGWVVLWSLPIKRPVVVWKAHQGTILGVGSWDDDKIITFGTRNAELLDTD